VGITYSMILQKRREDLFADDMPVNRRYIGNKPNNMGQSLAQSI